MGERAEQRPFLQRLVCFYDVSCLLRRSFYFIVASYRWNRRTYPKEQCSPSRSRIKVFRCKDKSSQSITVVALRLQYSQREQVKRLVLLRCRWWIHDRQWFFVIPLIGRVRLESRLLRSGWLIDPCPWFQPCSVHRTLPSIIEVPSSSFR